MARYVVGRGAEVLRPPDGRRARPARAVASGLARAVWAGLRRAVRWLDRLLRWHYGIREFSQTEECLLCIARSSSARDLTLSDGTRIHRGEPIGELHLWNEHFRLFADRGPDVAWALGFQHRLAASLRELAAYTQRDPEFRSLRAFRGEGTLFSRHGMEHLAKMAGHWGFELVTYEESTGLWRWFADFWKNLHALAVLWAFNPAGLKGFRLRGLRRDQLWMSRAVLVQRYGVRPSPEQDWEPVPAGPPGATEGFGESRQPWAA